ncbi:hypothetical protein BVER_00642 [Candidatus Burkholderia verschuerenii]|uniref:Uncharacterized protein n=2 Tax=Candidatus Burkholderia verschuerenii TaxID=242163 RepID=A0A0L0MCF4_9BURK|nr:hypothetical protein BVER_00642 [Candidatus Burkholderia verschuerenii]
MQRIGADYTHRALATRTSPENRVCDIGSQEGDFLAGCDMKRGSFSEAGRRRRRMFLSKAHVALAAAGTLGSCFGIGIAINGGLEFNRTKLFVGVGLIAFSTILYISMLFVKDDEPS